MSASAVSALPLRCEGSATVMTDYHICRYDPVLGVLVCVGDDSDVLVLGKNMCRRRIPVRRGVHWLDCFLYSGSSSILLLSPEGLDCVDYQACRTDTTITAGDSWDMKLTCIHVPQGLTCGAVGRRNGMASYFRLCDITEKEHELFWTTKETNVLELASNFIQPDDLFSSMKSSGKTCGAEQDQTFFPFGSLISLDSLPENPNTFIGVIAGVPGVLQWSIDTGKVATFFNARTELINKRQNMVATCKFTPGGNYVVATSTDTSQVFVWDVDRKKKGKVNELYWVIDLSKSIAHDLDSSSVEAFQCNEYRVGMYMARTSSGSGATVSDKSSQWFLLLNGQRDIVEVVLRVEDKAVVNQEQVIADLNVYTAKKGATAGAREHQNAALQNSLLPSSSSAQCSPSGAAIHFFKVFHVEACAPHCYWNSEMTDYDLDSLIITSSGGLHPLVVKRKRTSHGLESIQELREIPGQAPWCENATLMRLPQKEHQRTMKAVGSSSCITALDELLFGSSNLLDFYNKPCTTTPNNNAEDDSLVSKAVASEAVIASVIGWGEAVLLSPHTQQILRLNTAGLQDSSSLWSALADQSSVTLLEEILPSPESQLPAEVILRLTVFQDQILVFKYAIRSGVGRTILALDRASLLGQAGSSTMEQRSRSAVGLEKSRYLATAAKLVSAKMAEASSSGISGDAEVRREGARVSSTVRKGDGNRNVNFTAERGSWCLVLLLEDSSIALVDLSGKKSSGKDTVGITAPLNLVLRSSDFLPAGCQVVAVDTFWGTTPTFPEEALYLVALLGNEKGLIVWNMNTLQMMLYPQFSALADQLLIAGAVQPSVPNTSGDVRMFSVDLSVQVPPTDPGEYGVLTLSDAAGGVLYTLHVGFGMNDNACREWSFRSSRDPPRVWHAAGFRLDVKRFTMSCTISDDDTMHWRFTADGAAGQSSQVVVGEPYQEGVLRGAISYVHSTWSIGKALLFTQIEHQPMPKCQVLVDVDPRTGGRQARLEPSAPVIITVGPSQLSSIDIGALIRGECEAPASTIRLDANLRSLEDVSLTYHASRSIIIAVTKDQNGWRWINGIDYYTLKPCMDPLATLDFAGEERIKVLQVHANTFTNRDGHLTSDREPQVSAPLGNKETNSRMTTLHLYLVGATNGAIGHYEIMQSFKEGSSMEPHHETSITGQALKDSMLCDPFWPKHYDPAPGSFRRYHRYLPRRPSQKAESNFFKRLMVSPWEDMAEQLVGQTFQNVRRTSAPDVNHEKCSALTRGSAQAFSVQHSIGMSLGLNQNQSNNDTVIHISSYTNNSGSSHPVDVASTGMSVSSQPPIAATKNVVRYQPAPGQRVGVSEPVVPSGSPSYTPVASAAPSGYRYAQLKAIAQRENVSLTEARRMMSENVRKLQLRGEKLSAVSNKSEELAARAMTFQDLARQLKEKQKNSWL